MRQPWSNKLHWTLPDEMRFLEGCGKLCDKRTALEGYLLAPTPYHWTMEEEVSLRAHAERLLRGKK